MAGPIQRGVTPDHSGSAVVSKLVDFHLGSKSDSNQGVALLSATTAFFFMRPVHNDGLVELDREVSSVFERHLQRVHPHSLVPRILGGAWL